MAPSPKPKVTVAGAGIAGLTAALRLAQRGCEVTVLEMETVAGGNLAGIRDGEAVYEVYPHMFGEWYNNFWNLIRDIGLTREADFERRPACGFLRQGEFPNYRLLVDNGSARTVIPNLFSDIMPVPDMFLAAYAIIDLLIQDFGRDDMASEQTLNGFLVTRPYATERMAAFFNTLILNIWSVDSYLTSAYAYQRFAKYQFREPSPQCWVLKDNSYSAIIEPLCAALRELGCSIKCGVTVDGVTVRQGKVIRISYTSSVTPDTMGETRISASQLEDVENLILAVTPTAVHDLVMKKASVRHPQLVADDSADPVESSVALHERIEEVPIVQILTDLANTRRLKVQPIPVLYVTFKRELPDITEYYVALVGSSYSLTFVKIERLTQEAGGKTVLAIAASDFQSLPVELAFPAVRVDAMTDSEKARFTVWNEGQRAAMFLILQEFQRYVPFTLGQAWGDVGDVDWGKTFFGAKTNQNLFMNQVGSKHACPYTNYSEIENLYFAGENRNNPITIATVEAGVCSGLQAAQALWQKQGAPAMLNPIEIIEPRSYPLSVLLAWKFGLAPYAALAKCWAIAEDLSQASTVGRSAMPLFRAASAASLLAQSAASASNACIQWWRVMGSVVGLTGR